MCMPCMKLEDISHTLCGLPIFVGIPTRRIFMRKKSPHRFNQRKASEFWMLRKEDIHDSRMMKLFWGEAWYFLTCGDCGWYTEKNIIRIMGSLPLWWSRLYEKHLAQRASMKIGCYIASLSLRAEISISLMFGKEQIRQWSFYEDEFNIFRMSELATWSWRSISDASCGFRLALRILWV